MKCAKCGKTSNVSIGNRVYCTNCGAVISEQTTAAPAPTPAPAAPVATPTVPLTPTPATGPTLTDIAVRPLVSPIATPSSPPTPPTAAPAPVTPRLTDIAAPRPATDYHGQPAATAPVPPAAAPPPNDEPLQPITEHTSVPLPGAPLPAATVPAPPAAAADPPTPPANPAAVSSAEALIDRLTAAKQVPKSDSIVKFHPGVQAAPTPTAAVPPAPGPELPPAAATQHEALASLITPPPAASPSAVPKRPNPVAAGAAALVVVIMGGYIWLQNYPHLQLSAVAGKAGFTASLPGYLPSSYGLHGPITYQTGQVALHYQAPGQPGLNITQKLTDWDSQSLLDNYVAQQSPSYTAVNTQGLTIYLYGKNEAAWVNDGIWYSITGASNLSRSQILKIATSL